MSSKLYTAVHACVGFAVWGGSPDRVRKAVEALLRQPAETHALAAARLLRGIAHSTEGQRRGG